LKPTRNGLPSPIIAANHFRAKIGFIMPANPPSAADATFSASFFRPGIGWQPMTSVRDIGRDGIMPTIDIDLTSVAGATAAQDWTSWVAPRIEG